MLSKQRNGLFIHKRGDALQLYLTKMFPNISKLCEGGQAHASPWTGGHGRYRFLEIYYLLFALASLGGDNDVTKVKRGRWNK